ncbi:unnamed protein product [Clavelina lepadiformis]|uniref:Uncharacterized protein n=1 Tax=Clavelina lepadiformis TaxID=159417 RepID=A0ABP0H0L7_CLALP
MVASFDFAASVTARLCGEEVNSVDLEDLQSCQLQLYFLEEGSLLVQLQRHLTLKWAHCLQSECLNCYRWLDLVCM